MIFHSQVGEVMPRVTDLTLLTSLRAEMMDELLLARLLDRDPPPGAVTEGIGMLDW